MTTVQLLSFLFATILISISPGLNSMTVVQCSLSNGFKKTLPIIAGQITSLATIVAIVAGGVLVVPANVLLTIKLAGAIYLLYIGYKVFKSLKSNTRSDFPVNKTIGFWHGFLVNATNPKAIIFQTSFVPQFLVLGKVLWSQYLTLVIIMLVIEMSVLLLYAKLTSFAKTLINSDNMNFYINMTCGMVFVLLGLSTFIDIGMGFL